MLHIRIVLIALFVSSSLYMLSGAIKNISVVVIGTGLISLIFFLLIKQIKLLRVNRILLISFYLLGIAGTASSLYNNDLALLFNLLAIIGIYAGLSIALINITKEKSLKLIFDSVLLSNIILVVYSVFFYGVETTSYAGMFENSNAFGSVVATLFLVCAAFLMNQIINICYMHLKIS